MAVTKLKWSSLLQLTELDFIPEAPKTLSVSDELSQVISWLTGATKHDRKLLRCDENGALLISNAWSLLNSVETDILYAFPSVDDTYTATVANKGVLIATSTQIIKAGLIRISGGDTESIYIPPETMYWYPHKTYSLVVATVPAGSGSPSYIGVTAFN